MFVALRWHGTPLYGVETDLLGDTVPAVRALRTGHITRDTFQFRGPGYPLMLGAAASLTGGDEYLAARILNVLAAGVATGAAFLLFRAWLGPVAGLAVAAGMLANPVFVRNTIEAGSDLPALALALAATLMVVRGGGALRLAAAGLVAALAFLTRYNTLFLVPAALLVIPGGAGSARRLLGYGAGFAVPVGAWMLFVAAVTGEPPRNQNYLNVAYEVYGRGLGWDRFWAETGDPFRSFLGVVLHDPVRFLGHVGRNALTRWTVDARVLMPAWIGTLALPGLLITWWQRPGARVMALHAGLAYLVLTLVFYSPRFFLYLLPFYLAGTFGLLLRSRLVPPATPLVPAAAAGVRTPGWVARLGPWVAGALIALSAWSAIGETRRLLADAPDETRVGGALLRTLGRPGERVLARKPHAPYFARMEYQPIPRTEAFTDFLAEARKTRSNYLFVSPMEAQMHPQLAVLAEPDVALPGLESLAYRRVGRSFFALYRILPVEVSAAAVEDSLIEALRRIAERHPDVAWPYTYLGGHLVTMGRFREALGPLAEGERLDPREPLVARFQARAHAELGEYDAAAAACERGLTLVPEGPWERGVLGEIRFAQGRYTEARAELLRAMRLEPANARFAWLYMRACAAGGHWDDAVGVAEKIMRETPADASARLIGARAWLALGRPERARAVVARPGSVTGPDSAAYVRLADSLARAAR